MCSALEYTMFASAQLSHNWHKQWSSIQGDLDMSVMGEEVGRVYYMGWTCFSFHFYAVVHDHCWVAF
jgi:hypothetical protein